MQGGIRAKPAADDMHGQQRRQAAQSVLHSD